MHDPDEHRGDEQEPQVSGQESQGPGPDAGQGAGPAPSQALKLNQAAEILGISPRKLQYLRERGLVKPSIAGHGRGHHARYTRDDLMAVAIYLALEDMTEGEMFNQIMAAILKRDDELVMQLLDGVVEFRVYIDRLRNSVT
jgi:hypothetical protein